MWNDRYVPFHEPCRLEPRFSNQRYPARAAGDDMVFDCMLGAGRDLIGNLRRRWRFRDPWRLGRHVEEDGPGQMDGGEDVRQRVGTHRHSPFEND